ncbi:FGGY family carbohydrate kinase [Arcicella lustrica]|uniref:ATP:glycerol 3-phosphotransferase n=1 Tax=Arcicella lustrica TaxID=2984196 RepID=A0ABU5SN46_9BACT|nr:glycerol kinase GlpK [Arcicella sp. DC25W]MEA5428734.1 glycerol kinase GlpK [Arcicella sp. DC25W]
MQYILAIDQGTSSTKALIFDAKGQVMARASEPLQTQYLADGFVEQDPEGIFDNAMTAVKNCLADFQEKGFELTAIKTCGISNQRETFILWDENGNPLHNAVVWQCKRSVQVCERLSKEGLTESIKEKTGLIIDPYFSGTKLIWLYENKPTIKQTIDEDKAFFGTVDTWLLYKLTGGKVFATDYTNASRTLFFNLHTLEWDKDLLSTFNLSTLNLPEVKASSANFGTSTFGGIFTEAISISGMIGDSHAAAFGEGCFEAGTAKATLGTGCSILMNIGNKPQKSQNGMITTICWSTEGRIDYALEGAIVSCGASVEWVKNELGLFAESKQTEGMAKSVPDNGGVYLIPAFSGLGAPYWDMKRRASIHGLTFGTNKNHIVRATLESIPFQIKDVVLAMEEDSEIHLQELMVNGGMTSNTFVLSTLSDLLNIPVVNKGMPDVSALGVALMAGLGVQIFESVDSLKALFGQAQAVLPQEHNQVKILTAFKAWKNIIQENS